MNKEEIKLYNYIIKNALRVCNKKVCYGDYPNIGVALIDFIDFIEVEYLEDEKENFIQESPANEMITVCNELILDYLFQYGTH